LYEVADEVEQAISDIQFLGNEEQIKAAQVLVNQLCTEHSADLDPILFALRTEIRKELGRQPYKGTLICLRIGRKDENKRTGDPG